MNKVYFFSYFSDLISKKRNAPLACESISLYIKELLDSSDFAVEYVNIAPSSKSFCLEKNKTSRNLHQIGTICLGKIFRKFIWKKIYWKKIYKFCRKNISKDDLVIIYHSLYTNHLLKKVKSKIRCKTILIGAELYSDVTGNRKDRKLELETYYYSNAHILISNALKNEIPVKRPSLILSGDYRGLDTKVEKFSKKDGLIHLVYAGTFDKTKGGVYLAIDACKYLDDRYILHILGFGDKNNVDEYIEKNKTKAKIVFEGQKNGADFTNFLAKCDIGLSTQNITKQFNKSSFPSKIITYLKCGLSVIATPSESIINSPFKDVVSFSETDSGESISKAIISGLTVNSAKNTVKKINEDFSKSFFELIRKTLNSRRYLLINNCDSRSTGNIVRDIKSFIDSQGNDSLFCYLLGKKNLDYGFKRYGLIFEHYLSPLATRFSGNSLGYMFLSTKSLCKITARFKPDLVNVHCMNSYSLNVTKYFNFLKKMKYPTVITNHALFYATGTCGYPYGECTKYLEKCGQCPNKRYSCKSNFIDRTRKNWLEMKKTLNSNLFSMVSVSDYVKNICLSSPITSKLQNQTILNGVDTNIFKLYNDNFSDGKTHIMYVTSDSSNSNKGYNEFEKIAESLGKEKSIVFHVVGSVIENKSRINCVYHGLLKNKTELASLYSKCDICLITSRRETFSLPVVESLCCGTPVVGYKCGGPESFVDKNYVFLYDYGDTHSVAEFIMSRKYKEIDKTEISKKSMEKYSKNNMCNEYYNLFSAITDKCEK